MSGNDRVRELGGALGWSVAARCARVVLGLAGSVLVVRGLGAHEYGILAVLRNALAFVGIVITAGLGQGILRYLPVWRTTGGGPRLGTVLLSFLGLQGVLWIVALGVLAAARPWYGGLTGETVAGLFLLGAALLLPEILSQTLTQVSNAFYDARGVSGAVAVSTLTYVALVAWLLGRGGGIPEVLWSAAISNVVLFGLLAFRVRRLVGRPAAAAAAPPAAPGAPGLTTAVRYSLPFLVIGILNLITWRQSEVIFLGHFRTAQEAGFFDLAYRLPQMVLEFVPGAIWPLVMAGFSEVYTRDPGALQRAANAYYKLLFLLVAPLSVGGMLVGDLAVRMMYGPDYVLTGTVCQVFFFVFSLSFLATPLSMVLYVLERPFHALGVCVLTAALNLGLDLVLIPRFGVWGAVAPVTLVILVSPFLYTGVLRRMGVLVPVPWPFLLRVYGASGVMLLLWPLRALAGGGPGLGLLVGGGVVLYLVGLRAFRVIGPDERSLIERTRMPMWGLLQPVLAPKEGG